MCGKKKVKIVMSISFCTLPPLGEGEWGREFCRATGWEVGVTNQRLAIVNSTCAVKQLINKRLFTSSRWRVLGDVLLSKGIFVCRLWKAIWVYLLIGFLYVLNMYENDSSIMFMF